MTKLTTELLDKLQDNLLQFQDAYSDPADKENYDIFVDAIHMLDEFKAAKEKLLAYEQAAKTATAITTDEEMLHVTHGSNGQIFAECRSDDFERKGIQVIKLYAAPVLPKQPDATLTDEGTKIIKAAEKLVRCKGRYHSEQNYRTLAALFGVTVPDLPPLPSDEAPAQPDQLSMTSERELFKAWNNDIDCPIAGLEPSNAAWKAWISRAAIAPAQPVIPEQENILGYFSFDPEDGAEILKDRQTAIDNCNASIDLYRESMQEEYPDGWSDDVKRVCWGVILQEARGFDAQGIPENDPNHTYQTLDYRLAPDLTTAVTTQPESEIPFGDVEPMEVTDDMVYAFHNRLSDGSLTSDEFTDIKQGLCAALMNIPRPAQQAIQESKYSDFHDWLKDQKPYAHQVVYGDLDASEEEVIDAKATIMDMSMGWKAAIQSGAQPVIPDEITSASAPEVFEIAAEAERLGIRGTYGSYAVGWNACRAEMLKAQQNVQQNIPENIPEQPVGELRARAIALYKPPFKFDFGYIWDADGHMVADNNLDQDGQILRIRGWGRISYLENPEALQDEVGEVIALALSNYWNAFRAADLTQPVSEPYKLKDAVADIRNSGVEIDADKIKSERDALNSPVIPDGWKLVPIEPTAAMFHAFNDCDYGRKSMRERYIQMIEAAPAQESEQHGAN